MEKELIDKYGGGQRGSVASHGGWSDGKGQRRRRPCGHWSGWAAGGGTPQKPVGLVHIAVAHRSGKNSPSGVPVWADRTRRSEKIVGLSSTEADEGTYRSNLACAARQSPILQYFRTAEERPKICPRFGCFSPDRAMRSRNKKKSRSIWEFNMMDRARIVALIGGLLLPFSAIVASAQDFPIKPLTLIVPWPAGGSTDIAMRAIADSASKHLGQPIAVDNKAGGGGTVGPATMAASAKPDGYTIAQIPITVFRLPLMQDVTWDAGKDFTYIVHLTGYTFGVTTNAKSQFKSWKDARRFCEAKSGKSDLRNTRSRHIPAHRHGADREHRRHQADASPVQRRCGNQCGCTRSTYNVAG